MFILITDAAPDMRIQNTLLVVTHMIIGGDLGIGLLIGVVSTYRISRWAPVCNLIRYMGERRRIDRGKILLVTVHKP